MTINENDQFVTFNAALNDYIEWVANQPRIGKKYYTYGAGVPALVKLIVKHLNGVTHDRYGHICSFQYRGIVFVVKSKTGYKYSICENY